ncbi:unnamed protein product [Tenebrio molitor]|nr:unnamed protein product [Tenebrio molitor]
MGIISLNMTYKKIYIRDLVKISVLYKSNKRTKIPERK